MIYIVFIFNKAFSEPPCPEDPFGVILKRVECFQVSIKIIPSIFVFDLQRLITLIGQVDPNHTRKLSVIA